MARKQRLTPNQQAYRKEINRIRRFIRNAERRGYIFPEDVIPSMPKRVTKKSLERIQNIKPVNLYEQAKAVIAETGEIITGTEARRIERQAASRRAAQTRAQRRQAKQVPNLADVIIRNFKSYILGFPPAIADRLIAWLNTLINQQGKDDVARMLELASETLGDYLTRFGYDSKGALDEYTTAMMNYLPQASEAFKRDLQEQFENEELGYVESDYENA